MPLAMSLNLCNGIGPQGFFSLYRELLHPDMKKKHKIVIIFIRKFKHLNCFGCSKELSH